MGCHIHLTSGQLEKKNLVHMSCREIASQRFTPGNESNTAGLKCRSQNYKVKLKLSQKTIFLYVHSLRLKDKHLGTELEEEVCFQ